MEHSEEYENGVSMLDVLHEQEAMVEDADAVLGGVDEDKCTYSQGYKRQPIYACKTCSPEDGSARAGVCLACANHCHSNHNIVELFTKRNFCCDCGNNKLSNTKCTLNSNKDATNKDNKYNQNFDGVYCTCHRPYPDLERPEEEDEMIQCIVCEDWYHSKHLGGTSVPQGDQFGEMICQGCVGELPFMGDYASLAVCVITKDDTTDSVDVEGTNKEEATTSQAKPNELKEEKKDVTDAKVETKIEQPSKSDESKACTRGTFKGTLTVGAALFLPDQWRNKLCDCDICKEMYASCNVSYLKDSEDTISFYEQRAKEMVMEQSNGRTSREISVERELDALNTVDRVTRTEMVAEYNTLSSELRDYLRKFAENKKVVRDEDIKEFFSDLQARKKKRGNDGMPPNTCTW